MLFTVPTSKLTNQSNYLFCDFIVEFTLYLNLNLTVGGGDELWLYHTRAIREALLVKPPLTATYS